MAVYKRTYKPYTGAMTPEWSRFLILPRFAWRTLFQQRFILILYVICFFYPIGAAVAIYLNHNVSFMGQFMPKPTAGGLFEVGGDFFLLFTSIQSGMAFLLTSFVLPGLVSGDLANNALPLYFCRPFSRTEYVLGKLSVIALLLAFVTWIPGLILFCIQWSLEGSSWFSNNSWLAGSIFLTNFMWTILISLLALAISAWVRWRIVAGAMLLVIFFLGAGLAQAINAVLRTDAGYWIDLGTNFGQICVRFYRTKSGGDQISTEEAVASLLVMSALSVWLLWRKVRAYEVAR
jgi:ABC-2 type transport system permease protein